MKKSRPTDKKTRLKPPIHNQAFSNPAVKTGPIWVFKLLTILLVPAAILGFLELALTVSGFGYPTSFFVKSRIDDQDFLIPNYKFSYRFFPPALARRPAAYRIPAEKPAGTYRIFVFGGSAALGTPDWSYGVSRYLEVLLEERYPDTDFEVVCAAMTAINSHVALPIARECAQLDGDLWVVYLGNNEMVGPFGASTVFGAKAPGLGFVRTSLALKKTRLGQLMAHFTSQLGPKSQVPDQWEGINMFKNNLLRHDDQARLRAYRNFEGNLKDMLKTGRKAGVPIILSTVGSNLKDCSPFASLHREDLETSSKREWDRLFQAGLALEKTGRYEEALSRYNKAAAIDAEYAELHFRTGTCLLALGHTERARQAFAKARDHDALAVRADSRINRILTDAMLEAGSQVHGVDAADALSAQSPAGIPGQELFYEHVHFTTEGNYTLARMMADQVQPMLPAEILESQTERWQEYEACSRWLALTLWDQLRLWQEEFERTKTMPFISQSSNASNRDYIRQHIQKLSTRVTKNSWDQDHQVYVSALDRTPEDAFLVANYAQFLDGGGLSERAIVQAERFRALLPDLAWPHYYRAALLAKEGRLQEAREGLEKALEIRGDFIQARELLKQIQ